jgi:hypothetical protein
MFFSYSAPGFSSLGSAFRIIGVAAGVTVGPKVTIIADCVTGGCSIVGAGVTGVAAGLRRVVHQYLFAEAGA